MTKINRKLEYCYWYIHWGTLIKIDNWRVRWKNGQQMMLDVLKKHTIVIINMLIKVAQNAFGALMIMPFMLFLRVTIIISIIYNYFNKDIKDIIY